MAGGPWEAVDRPLTALPGPKRSMKTTTRPQSTRVEFQRLSMISGRRACHPIRHLTRRVGPPWRKDLLTKLSCTTESYCAGFLGLATFKTEFWPFQRLSMISGGKGVDMYTLLVFSRPFLVVFGSNLNKNRHRRNGCGHTAAALPPRPRAAHTAPGHPGPAAHRVWAATASI